MSDDDDTVRWWFTAGGGVDDDESLLEAAHRELQEETGRSHLRLVGPLYHREFEFLNHGERQHQVEHFFAARTDYTTLNIDAWTELEQRAMTTWRWWSAAELETVGVLFFPDNLIDLMRRADDLVWTGSIRPTQLPRSGDLFARGPIRRSAYHRRTAIATASLCLSYVCLIEVIGAFIPRTCHPPGVDTW